ncbi:C69 family dipeptidase, partial [Pseudomonas aeruginosa]
RHHGPRGDHFRRHNNRQVCMHAGSFWRPSQTTASLVARLRDDGPLLAATGTSAPEAGSKDSGWNSPRHGAEVP